MQSSWSHRYHALLDRKREIARLNVLSTDEKLALGQINTEIAYWEQLREVSPLLLGALRRAVESARQGRDDEWLRTAEAVLAMTDPSAAQAGRAFNT